VSHQPSGTLDEQSPSSAFTPHAVLSPEATATRAHPKPRAKPVLHIRHGGQGSLQSPYTQGLQHMKKSLFFPNYTPGTPLFIFKDVCIQAVRSVDILVWLEAWLGTTSSVWHGSTSQAELTARRTGTVMLGWQLDSMIFQVFSNLNDSMAHWALEKQLQHGRRTHRPWM